MAVKKTFLEIQPKLWQALYILFKEHDNACSAEEIKTRISTVLQQYKFDADAADATATQIFSILYDTVVSIDPATLYYEEDQQSMARVSYMDVYDINQKLSSEKDPRISRLLLSLVVYARTFPHPSNWIRFNKKEIFHLAGLSKLSTREQDTLTSRLHNEYGFNMQVIGSTQPIPCFSISWLAPISDDNPLIEIGRFLPETIKTYSSNLLVK